MAGLELPQTPVSKGVGRFIDGMGRSLSWIWALLLVVIVFNVCLSYFFNEGRIELEELQWHLYSIGFLFGASYAYQYDSHVRVDVISSRLSLRAQAWLELYGILLALLPFIALVLIYGVPFVVSSFNLSEISQAPGGLPYRWLIKAMLPLSFLLLLLAVIARLTQVWEFLFGTNPGGDNS